jgi:hemerythrin superfamily protein
MNAITMLKTDHQTVKKLFREFEAAGERAHKTKQKLGDQILHELDVHAALEEEIFYPAVQAKAPKELAKTLAEGIQEHHIVHVLIGELRALTASDEQYEPKMTVLIENVEHHIEEEEGELLPQAQQLLGNDVEALGGEMAARKQQLQREAAGTAAR